jgi:hypothetical protein
LATKNFQLTIIQSTSWRPKKFGCLQPWRMATKRFWSPNFLSALNFTYIKGFTFSFFLTFFSMCMTLVVLDNLSTTFKKGGGGTPCIILFFVISIFHKMKYVKQSNWKKDNPTSLQMGQPHHCDLGLWRGKCHIFPRLRKRKIWCGYFLVTKRLIVQGHMIDIPCQN